MIRPFLDQAGERPAAALCQSRLFRVFLATLAVTALAKGAAFLPGYAIDDYGGVLQRSPLLSELLLDKGGRGRFGSALVLWFLDRLQLAPQYSRFFFVACSIFTLALLGTLVARYWGLAKRGGLAAAVACMVANHPFTAEIFSFRLAHAIYSLSLGIVCVLLIPTRWTPRLILAGSALFAVALSMYQIVLHYILMILLVGAAVWLTRYLILGGSRGWPKRVTSLLTLRRLARHRNAGLVVCVLLGMVLYTGAAVLLTLALGVGRSQRTHLLPLHQVDERAGAVLDVLKFRLTGPSPLVPELTKQMLLLILLSAVAGVLWRARPWLRLRPSILTVVILALLGVSLVWTLGILLVLQEFWPAPRVISHMAVFWAGTLAIGYYCAGPRVRGALGLLASLIVLSFLGSNNRILDDQLRLNARDAHKASRIVARLEALPGIEAVRLVAVEGGEWMYPLGFRTSDHDMNVSAFGVSWARAAILAEISGYDLQAAMGEPELKAAVEYCRDVQPWPGSESVAIQGSLAILCLGR